MTDRCRGSYERKRHYQEQISIYLLPHFLLVLLLVAIGDCLEAVAVLAFRVLFRYLKMECKQQEGAKPYFSVPAETVQQFSFMTELTALPRGLLFDTHSRQCFCIHSCSCGSLLVWCHMLCVESMNATEYTLFITSPFRCTSKSTNTKPP